jgi:cysteine desulfurase
LNRLISGGEQEFGLRGGTSNAPADLVLQRHCVLPWRMVEKYHDQIRSMKERLVAGLLEIPDVEINSPEDGVVSTVNFSYEGIPSEVMQNALNAKGFMVSARSTCASRSDDPSYVLTAMGFFQAEEPVPAYAFHYHVTIQQR